MKVLKGLDNVPHFSHAVATIGSYDGVHCGHGQLIGRVVDRAKAIGGESVVITFEPHPRITLGRAEGLKLLSTVEEKALLMESMGVDYLVVINFDLEFSRLSHEEFIERIIIGTLHIEELVVGYNHHFGHNKSGNYSYLTQSSLRVTEVGQHTVEDSKVSSTIVRQLIEQGDMTSAVRLLGHQYTIIGHCDQQGMLEVDSYKLLPPAGRYKAQIEGKASTIEIADSRQIRCEGFQNCKITIKI